MKQKFNSLKTNVLKPLFFLLFVVVILSACEQEAGKGGTSSIKGTVIVQEYSKDLIIKIGDPYPAQDVDVYLIYGNDEVHGDVFKTGWDGKFEFNYLKQGTYTVYVLSKSLDNPVTKEKVPVKQVVEITGKDQVADVGSLNIID